MLQDYEKHAKVLKKSIGLNRRYVLLDLKLTYILDVSSNTYTAMLEHIYVA